MPKGLRQFLTVLFAQIFLASVTCGAVLQPTSPPVLLPLAAPSINVIPGVENFDPAIMLPHAVQAAARQRANAGPFTSLWLGDSVTAGLGIGTGGTYNWTGARQRAYPWVAAQILKGQQINTNATAVLSDGASGSLVFDTQTTFGPGWSTTSNSLGGSLWVNTTTSNPITHTPLATVNTCDVYYPDTPAGGQFTLDLDGAGTITKTVAATGGYLKATITGTDGTHTLHITRLGGTIYIGVISCYSTVNYPIIFMNAGWSGSQTTNAAQNTSSWTPIPALKTLAPDLTFINYMINDEAFGVSVATRTANMQAIIDAAKLSGDVVLIMHNDTNQGTPVAQAETLALLQGLARANNIPLMRFDQRLGPFAQAGALMYDGKHPNQVGHAAEAKLAAMLIGSL